MAGTGRFIGGISFGVFADTGKLGKDLNKGRAKIASFASSATKQFALVGAAATAGLAVMVKSSLESIDALTDTAKALNVTTESLSGMQFASEQNDGSSAAMVSGLEKIAQFSGKAARGVKTAADTFASLGLNAQEMAKLSPDQQFLKLAGAVSKLNTKEKQLDATQRIFGKTLASDLIGTLRLGKEGLISATGEARNFGGVISSLDAEKVSEAANAINRMKTSFGAASNQLTIALAPAIADAADKVAEFANESLAVKDAFSGDIKGGWLGTLGDTVGAISDGFAGLKFAVTDTISSTITQVDELVTLLKNVPNFIKDIGTPGLGSKSDIKFGQNGGLSVMAEEMRRAAAEQKLAFDNALTGKTFSERMQGLESPLDKSGPMASTATMDLFASSIEKALFNAGKAMGQTTNGLPAGFTSLAGMMSSLGGGKKTVREQSRISRPSNEFSLHEAGSIEAYQQKIRGQQQYDKVPMQQLKVLEKIERKLAPQVVISPIGR